MGFILSSHSYADPGAAGEILVDTVLTGVQAGDMLTCQVGSLTLAGTNPRIFVTDDVNGDWQTSVPPYLNAVTKYKLGMFHLFNSQAGTITITARFNFIETFRFIFAQDWAVTGLPFLSQCPITVDTTGVGISSSINTIIDELVIGAISGAAGPADTGAGFTDLDTASLALANAEYLVQGNVTAASWTNSPAPYLAQVATYYAYPNLDPDYPQGAGQPDHRIRMIGY